MSLELLQITSLYYLCSSILKYFVISLLYEKRFDLKSGHAKRCFALSDSIETCFQAGTSGQSLAMQRKSLLQKIKLLDVYPKTAEEAKQSSPYGALVTIIGGIVLLLLIVSEIAEFNTPVVDHSLTVYVGRGEKMKINFRVVFLELSLVNFDVTDRFDDDQVSVGSQHITKKPWQGDFTKLKESVGEAGWFGESVQKKFWNILGSKTLGGRFPTGPCLSCFEAAGKSPAKCCNTCHELKRAFVHAGLDPSVAAKYPQCVNAEKDGCLVAGTLEVNKAQGNFHIAVGESHLQAGQKHHHHWPAPERQLGFNTSHYINHLSFGDEYPGMENPLDGYTFVETGIGQQQYFLQVVPTLYIKAGKVVETNQYSVTHHHTVVDLQSEHIELPGVFFKYDISPIMVKIKETPKPFFHFITRICAVIGGTWVVLGMIYSMLHSAVDVVKKMELKCYE